MKLLHTYVEDACRAYPDHVAIQTSDRTCTYAELNRQSEQIAAAIQSRGVRESVVAVFAPKCIPTYASVLGTLRSGNAYCPLNPKFPVARNLAILKASLAPLLTGPESDPAFTEFIEHLRKETSLIEDQTIRDGVHYISLRQKPNEVLQEKAYLLFTSGTTGVPKGVLISHAQVHNYLETIHRLITVSAGDRCSHTFDLTFDLSVHDLFVTWSKGARLCVPGDADLLSPAAYIKAFGITTWFSVPSLAEIMRKLRQLKDQNLPSLHTVLFCGEALHYNLVEAFRKASPQAVFMNLYGPTEATIAISAYRVEPSSAEGIVEIGHVFEGNSYRLSSESELELSGKQVITAYYNDANPNAFVHEGENTWYKTGDLVKESEGTLIYRGRLDEQVKYKGYRMELKEIEQAAMQYTGARNVVCLAMKEGEIVKQLVLVIEGEKDEALKQDVMSRLKTHLPNYMLPESLRFVEQFPLNNNGKTDKNALYRMMP